MPLEAQVEALEPTIGKIKDRIFSVELYAGLVEEVAQVRRGKPAPFETKIHLLQRRCYMDEECLADYRTGGMEIKGLRGFDRWLAQKTNLDRVMPFPRCVAAFQVRRHVKHREWQNVSDFVKVLSENELDKLTFLYLRNGDQLFRLSTEIDFGMQLFPDMEEEVTGKLYADVSSSGVRKTISEGRYQEMLAEEAAAEREGKGKGRSPFIHCESEKYEAFSIGRLFFIRTRLGFFGTPTGSRAPSSSSTTIRAR